MKAGLPLMVLLGSGWLAPAGASAAEAVVAVATNFVETAAQLEAAFEEKSGHVIRIAGGSTGKLYAQIVQGAPFDVLLSADQERPQRLQQLGLGQPGSQFTYAIGRLVLWSPDERMIIGEGRDVLAKGEFAALAIANPALAPYGAAARQALQRLELWASLDSRIVQGENIGQAFTFVATRNAELGFVALSQVVKPKNTTRGSRWAVPATLHDPIRQDAILLQRGAGNPAAEEFVTFLKSESTRRIIEASGYGTE